VLPNPMKAGGSQEPSQSVSSRDGSDSASRVNPVKRCIKLKAPQFFLRGLPEDVISPAHRAKHDRYRLQTAASR
jgi:hypothetical protein